MEKYIEITAIVLIGCFFTIGIFSLNIDMQARLTLFLEAVLFCGLFIMRMADVIKGSK